MTRPGLTADGGGCGGGEVVFVDPAWAQAALDEVATKADWASMLSIERELFDGLVARPSFTWSCGQVKILEQFLRRVRGHNVYYRKGHRR